MELVEPIADSVPHHGVRSILVVLIAFSPTNPRARMDEASLRELTESVRQHGVLQPVLVRPRWAIEGPPPPYELICGHRRLAAARAAGLHEIPAIVREMDDASALELQITENIERADLHPLDEARRYERLITVHKYDAQRIGDRIGRSARYVHDRVKLLQLVPALQQLFLEGRISAGHAVVLARLKPSDQGRAVDEHKGGLWQHEALLWEQVEAYAEINRAAKAFALAIFHYCPPCSDRSDAIRQVRSARMMANVAIATRGEA